MPAGQNGSNEVKKLARKTRSGQPGNTNALKHGFYTQNFKLKRPQAAKSPFRGSAQCRTRRCAANLFALNAGGCKPPKASSLERR